MSTQLEDTTLATSPTQVDAKADALIRYPPFPLSPPGVTITPFSDFVPKGIVVSTAPDQVELDGEGIPTVHLRAKGIGKKKKKKKGKAGNVGGDASTTGAAPGATWWARWEKEEESREIHVFNQTDTDSYDRLKQATHEFVLGRTWPAQTHSVHRVWNIFKSFVGLIEIIQSRKSWDRQDPDEADDACDGEPLLGGEYPRANQPHDSSIEEVGDEHELTTEETKMKSFMQNPERSIKIFLSSHFRKTGLSWGKESCVTAPRLLVFYLTFILRSRAVPSPMASENLERAVLIAKLALKELPATFSMGNPIFHRKQDGTLDESPAPIPGRISEALFNTWGTRRDPYDYLLPDLPSPADTFTAEAVPHETFGVDQDNTINHNHRNNVGNKSDASDDNASGWGSSVAWGAADTRSGAWGPAANDVDDDTNTIKTSAWETTTAWDTFANNSVAQSWSIHQVTAIELMGPTQLPLTHTTGIVERSTRRIVAVYPPGKTQADTTFPDAAGAVEHDLLCRFGRLLLAPWGTSAANSDIIQPEILKRSRGIVTQCDTEGTGRSQFVDDDDKLQAQPHHPHADNIAILVDAEAVNHFVINMGIGATWVQIIRVGEDGTTDRKGAPSGFWYMEEVSQTMVSFYTDDEPGEHST